MMIRRLQSGDILLQMTEAVTPAVTAENLQPFCATNASHTMIYDSNGNNEGTVIHSARGRYQSGVRSHALSLLQPIYAPIGWCLVLPLNEDELSEKLVTAARRWDIKLSAKEMKDELIKKSYSIFTDSENMTHLQTKFTAAEERKADQGSPEQINHYELYRAFRAYLRNHAKPVRPLSKNKGVSCSNFVSYALKVAAIETIFPHGLTTEIKDKLNEIEAKKTGKIKKLSQLQANFPEDFAAFEEIVSKHLKKLAKADNINYLELLYHPVKAHDIDAFCQSLFKLENLCAEPGVLVYGKSDNGALTPYVLSHAAYLALPDNICASNNSILPTDMINQLLNTKAENVQVATIKPNNTPAA